MATNIGTIKSGTFAGHGAGTTATISNVIQDSGSNRYMYLVLNSCTGKAEFYLLPCFKGFAAGRGWSYKYYCLHRSSMVYYSYYI